MQTRQKRKLTFLSSKPTRHSCLLCIKSWRADFWSTWGQSQALHCSERNYQRTGLLAAVRSALLFWLYFLWNYHFFLWNFSPPVLLAKNVSLIYHKLSYFTVLLPHVLLCCLINNIQVWGGGFLGRISGKYEYVIPARLPRNSFLLAR